MLRLTGRRAGEGAFKRLAPSFDVLHIATHGFFLDQQQCPPGEGKGTNPLLLSGLAFAGANRRTGGEGEDGILTAEEVAALDLSRASWAVLSACESGLGRAQSGEGVLGLRRAFLVAGIKSIRSDGPERAGR